MTARDEFEDVVTQAVASLFINGGGDIAERLVLTDAAGRDLGGWCREAVRDQLEAFARRVRDAERERCARAVEKLNKSEADALWQEDKEHDAWGIRLRVRRRDAAAIRTPAQPERGESEQHA